MKFIKKFIIISLLSVFSGILLTDTESRKEGLPVWTFVFTNLKKEKVTVYCEVASTEKQQRKGLMFREHMNNNECMIFVYNNPQLLRFWMKNTRIPLSIGFFGEEFNLQEVFHMNPLDESLITSTMPAQYAMEMNRGWYHKNLVYPGMTPEIIKSDLRPNKISTDQTR